MTIVCCATGQYSLSPGKIDQTVASPASATKTLPPQGSIEIPRWVSYQARSASGSAERRKIPPIPTTRSTGQGAVRSFATNAACVTGISRSRNVSAAAAYCWISYWAFSWLRRPQKCISERGLQLQ